MKHDLQPPHRRLAVAGREVEIVPGKLIRSLLRRKQQAQGVQQTRFAPGVFADQQGCLGERQRQMINAAKAGNLDMFQNHDALSSGSAIPL